MQVLSSRTGKYTPYRHNEFLLFLLQVGYDVFNRPILFEHSGAVDGHAIHQMTTTEKLIHYHWWSMETNLNDMFEKAPRKEGEPPIISTCVILDLSGLNMHHCTGVVLEHVKAMVALDNVCYPEILGKMLVVNAPWLAGKLMYHTLLVCCFMCYCFVQTCNFRV